MLKHWVTAKTPTHKKMGFPNKKIWKSGVCVPKHRRRPKTKIKMKFCNIIEFKKPNLKFDLSMFEI